MSLLILGNSVIVYSNLTAVQSVQAAFRRKNDPELARIDVPTLLEVAESGFPSWTWTLQKARNTAVFTGAAFGLILLGIA